MWDTFIHAMNGVAIEEIQFTAHNKSHEWRGN
jgi:hypothetical protein